MGNPLKAIPQVITEDKKLADVLNALKYVIDVREGRGTADAGKMWVTFEDLSSALNGVKSLIKEALMETLTGIVEDGSIASILTDIKTCACTVPSANCLYFTDGTNDCDGVNLDVSPIPDTSGLDSMVTDKAFLHVGAALAYARDAQCLNLRYVSFQLGNEDPDCVNDTYFCFDTDT